MVFIGKKAKVDDLTSDFVLMGINCQVKNALMINYLMIKFFGISFYLF